MLSTVLLTFGSPAAVVRWHHQQVAYYIQQMKNIQESDGRSLLDNSMLLYGSSLADGHEHADRNLPLILAGGGGGSIETGRLLEFKRPTSVSRLHLATLRRLGLEASRFGETTDPLEEVIRLS